MPCFVINNKVCNTQKSGNRSIARIHKTQVDSGFRPDQLGVPGELEQPEEEALLCRKLLSADSKISIAASAPSM